MHGARVFLYIFLCVRDVFFLESLEPTSLSMFITNSSLTKLFYSTSLLLLSSLFLSVWLFSSTSLSSPSSSFSLKLFSKISHSVHAVSFRSSWNRFHKYSGHAQVMLYLTHLLWAGAMLHYGQITWISEHDDMMGM